VFRVCIYPFYSRCLKLVAVTTDEFTGAGEALSERRPEPAVPPARRGAAAAEQEQAHCGEEGAEPETRFDIFPKIIRFFFFCSQSKLITAWFCFGFRD